MNIVNGNPFFTKEIKNKQFPYLDKDIKSDIVIVGGGITSLITAYYLQKNNFNVVILEKNRIAYGSTSITTALLQYELDDNINKLREYYKEEDLECIYLECNKALSKLEDICKIINCEYNKKDCILYSNKDIDLVELKQEFLFREKIGLNVKFFNYNNEIKNAILSIDGGLSFNPYEFCIKLSDYLINNNVAIYENTSVINITDDIIYTKYNYKVDYNKVIIATGYDISSFTNKKLGDVYYTYNIVTNKINFTSNLLIRDNNDPYNYYRVDNNRIIAGGLDTKELDVNKVEEIYDNLLKNIKTVYNVKDIHIEYKYCGVFKSTKDNLGYFSKYKNNTYFALGYGANGIVYAILGSEIIVDELNNKTNKLSKYFKIER